VEQIYPAYFQRREDQIDETADLQKRIAKLRLYGPRNLGDLEMEYWLRTHPEQVPKGAIYDWRAWYTEDAPNIIFQRGLFNPNRYVGRAARPAMYDANGQFARYDTRADPQGDQIGRFGFQLGTGIRGSAAGTFNTNRFVA
jgi:hypothetical protein